jgi:hypothetical protein
MFDSHERGTHVGIYFAMPLLGPSLAPMIGGALVRGFGWRSTFWFLAIFGGISLISFVLFRETFRKERSAAYQAAIKRAQQQAERNAIKSTKASRNQLRTVSSARGLSNELDDLRLKFGPDLENRVQQSRVSEESHSERVKLSLADVNPIQPSWIVLKQRTNMVILLANGKLSCGLNRR